MPLPRVLGRFNRVVTNRVLGPLAGRVPPLATVIHTGRRTGQTHRTVVMAFVHGETVAFALTYGRDVDWARNLLAAGGGRLHFAGDRFSLSDIRLVGDARGRPLMPAPVRTMLSLIGVHDYLLVTRA